MDEKPKQFTSSSAQWEKLKPLVREMRHQPTPAEDALWQKLRNRQVQGAKFRRQHSIEGFIVDFVCVEHRLIIEVDGSIHEMPDQQSYDEQRQAFLEAQGFCIMRFTNDAALQSIDAVVEAINSRIRIES